MKILGRYSVHHLSTVCFWSKTKEPREKNDLIMTLADQSQ